MTYEEILAALKAKNPDALLLEPRDIYDPCIVDMTDAPDDHWPREPGFTVAVYSAEMCIEATADSGDGSWQAAAEYFDYNMAGSWLGPNTPAFKWDSLDEE